MLVSRWVRWRVRGEYRGRDGITRGDMGSVRGKRKSGVEVGLDDGG